MCTINFPKSDFKKQFDLKTELVSLIGNKRANNILLKIEQRFKNYFPIQAESLAFSGNGRFDDTGKYLNNFNHKDELYNYLITFKKKSIINTIEVDQTFYYAFN